MTTGPSSRPGARHGGTLHRQWISPTRSRPTAAYLLDTHILLWWLADPDRLDGAARDAIADTSNAVCVSVASIWEMSIKRTLGRLDYPSNLPEILDHAQIEVLPITTEHALAVADLPLHHRDPFDRMIVAQARAERMMVITTDAGLAKYGVEVLASSG